MNLFNAVTTAIFDVILAPFGHWLVWFDLIVWSLIGAVVALVVYRFASNQKGIERVKEQIKTRLLEIRLWRHDMVVVARATVVILLRNTVYIGHNLLPMAVMAVPMLTLLVQLEANYAFVPSPVGAVELFEVVLDPASPEVKATDVKIDLPAGVVLDAPPVRTADGEVYYRLRAEEAGDHQLELSVGDVTETKTWAVGGEERKVPVMRTKSWLALLYPGEPGLSSESPFYSMTLAYPSRSLPWLPDGELGVLVVFFGLSLVGGYAMKGLFGVTL